MPEFRITTDDGVEAIEHVVSADDESGARALGRGFRRAHVTRVELVTDEDRQIVVADPDAPEGEQFQDPANPDGDTEIQKRLWPIFGRRPPEKDDEQTL